MLRVRPSRLRRPRRRDDEFTGGGPTRGRVRGRVGADGHCEKIGIDHRDGDEDPPPGRSAGRRWRPATRASRPSADADAPPADDTAAGPAADVGRSGDVQEAVPVEPLVHPGGLAELKKLFTDLNEITDDPISHLVLAEINYREGNLLDSAGHCSPP